MRKRIISCILVVFILLFMVLNLGSNITKKVNISEGNIPLSDGRESEAQALEFVSKLGTGWNLGNSFCCCDANSYGAKSVEYYEKLWGNPVITKASIDEIKAKGFKTIRIPIKYSGRC